MPKTDPDKTVSLKFSDEGLPLLSDFPLELFDQLPPWVLHLSQLPQAQRQQSIPYMQLGNMERNCGTCMNFNRKTEDSLHLPDGRILGWCEWNRSSVGSHNLCPYYSKGNPGHVD